MSRRRTGKRGFSLVEVILAMGLTAILLTSFATIHVQALHVIASAGRKTVAVALAQGIMEELLERPADDLVYFLQGAPAIPAAVLVQSDTRVSGSVAEANWGARAGSRLPGGYARVRLEAAGKVGVPVAKAQGVRVTVTVGWVHRNSGRTFVLERVRF